MSEPTRAALSVAECVFHQTLGVFLSPEVIDRETALPEMVMALKAARKAMTNQRYLKPRIGMESEYAAVTEALRKAGEL